MGANFPEKKHYVAPEWPLSANDAVSEPTIFLSVISTRSLIPSSGSSSVVCFTSDVFNM